MTNYTQGPATCKHPSIVAWTLAEGDDAGEPAGLWSCRDCGHKFYPWTAVEEAVRAEVKGLQDKLDRVSKLLSDWEEAERQGLGLSILGGINQLREALK